MTFRTAILVLTLAGMSAWAQVAPPPTPAPAPAPARAAQFGGAVRSPEVAPDGRVTFRLRAPNAKEVFVTGLGPRLPMQKNEQGVWTVTTDPLKPDIYSYSFSVDGATFNDPANPLFKTAFTSAGQSLFHVPGPVVWEPTDGARGAISHYFYKSAIIGDNRDYYVYTPPNYDANRKEPYPVLYLLHGLGDDAGAWLGVGAANVILDNLIKQGKARPMIMVNTLGYGTADMMSGGGRGGGMMGGEKMMENFARALVEEVMPQVEKAYRVTKDRNQRAIAGLSMGGAEALYTGLNYMDRFAWIGSFSGAFVMYPRASAAQPAAAATPPGAPVAAAPAAPGAPAVAGAAGRGGRGGGQSMEPGDFDRSFPKLDAKANAQLRLVWIACGADDGLNGVNRQFKAWLKSRNIQFTDLEIPGYAHVWPLWRQNLAELAPLLFQPKGK